MIIFDDRKVLIHHHDQPSLNKTFDLLIGAVAGRMAPALRAAGSIHVLSKYLFDLHCVCGFKCL